MPALLETTLERTQAFLARIAASDERLRAFITVCSDEGLAQAKVRDMAARAGEALGLLHGMIIAVKDCIDVAGVRCTRGSSFFADRVAAEDAPVIARLSAAGAVIIGKTNLHEFAFGGTSQNAFFGGCRNPWDPRRVPGGSSGGSAVAVAAGLADAALGTDTGSSIRMPAALTGIAGFRPTAGSVSSVGVFPVSPPYDIVGPMARRVDDVARMLAVIMDAPPKDGRACLRGLSDGVAGLRIAAPDDFFFAEADRDVAEAVLDAARTLERRGARLVRASIDGASEAQSHLTSVLIADAANLHRDRLAAAPDKFSEGVRKRLQPGLEMRAIDYARSLRWIEAWRERCALFFVDTADAILSPTVPTVAPIVESDDKFIETTNRLGRFCWAWSAAGMPALTTPCGFSSAGLPIGMQLAGPRGDDFRVLRIGHAYQQMTDWHERLPPASQFSQ